MSEYNIVPRTNGDGNIGTPTKKWNEIYANSINKEALPNATAENKGAVIVGDNITVNNGTISITKSDVVAALGYSPATNNNMLKPSTTYAVGDQVYSDQLPYGMILECVQAGTTDSTELDLTEQQE